MMAEVVVDVLNDAIGVKEKFGNDAPPDCRAIEIGASRVNGSVAPGLSRLRSAAAHHRLRLRTLFRPRPDAEAVSDGRRYARQQNSGRPDNRLKPLLADHKDDNEALDELFLAALTRLPTDKEREKFTAYRATHKDRRAAFGDALWALVNTSEFILNH